MSSFFCDDDYDIRDMVERYKFDYDYGVYYDCYDFDDYYFDRVDREFRFNEGTLFKNLEGEPSEEDFKEFVESELVYIGWAGTHNIVRI